MTERITPDGPEQPATLAAPGRPDPEEATVADATGPTGAVADTRMPRTGGRLRRGSDALFRYLSTGAGLTIVVAVVLIGLFLLIKAYPSLRVDEVNFLTNP